MKKLLFLLLTVILASCVSTKESNTESVNEEPYWFNDTLTEVSGRDKIIFKAFGKSSFAAEKIILEQSEYISGYIKPVKEKEFISGDGSCYLLYSVDKGELSKILSDKINTMYSDIKKNVSEGDLSYNILEKYSSYSAAMNLFSKIDNLLTLAEKDRVIVKIKNEVQRSDVEILLTVTKKELVFNVVVKNDINSIIRTGIERDLHNSGFSTSPNGNLIIEGELVLEDADLGNGYLNKYWSFTLNIKDYYDESLSSFLFTGRESQLSSEALNQTIAGMVLKKSRESITSLLYTQSR